MKLLRISAAAIALGAMTALAACGGGSGGGTPPVNNQPPPATQPPATQPPATQPPATQPPATQPPTGPSSIAANSTVDFANTGYVPAGTENPWNPASGDTSTGGQNQAVGSVTCNLNGEPTSTTTYHMHTYLGIIINGTQVQVPGAIGIVNPVPGTNSTHGGVVYDGNAAGGCMYQIHTHDESGLIHLEDPSQPQGSASHYNLQQVFDVWGNGPGASGFPAGTVSIYAGTPSSKVNGDDFVSSYNLVNGAANTLQLTRHMAAWVIVGTVPTSLPAVQFSLED